jgi:hypothetical protein
MSLFTYYVFRYKLHGYIKNWGTLPLQLSQYSDYATGWTIRVQFPAWAGIFLSSPSRPESSSLRSIPASYPMGMGCPSPNVRQPGREVDNTSTSNAEVKNARSYTSTISYVFMDQCLAEYRIRFHGMVLSQAHGQLRPLPFRYSVMRAQATDYKDQ